MKTLKTLFLTAVLATFFSCSTAPDYKVENALVLFEYGMLSEDFPHYGLEYYHDEYFQETQVSFFLYKLSSEGLPLECEVHYFDYQGGGEWTPSFGEGHEENWIYSWEEGRSLGVRFDESIHREVTWKGDRLVSAVDYWDGRVELEQGFRYLEGRLINQFYRQHWNDGDFSEISQRLVYEEDRLKALERTLGDGSTVRNKLVFDERGNLQKKVADLGESMQLFFYEPWEEGNSFTDMANLYFPEEYR